MLYIPRWSDFDKETFKCLGAEMMMHSSLRLIGKEMDAVINFWIITCNRFHGDKPTLLATPVEGMCLCTCFPSTCTARINWCTHLAFQLESSQPIALEPNGSWRSINRATNIRSPSKSTFSSNGESVYLVDHRFTTSGGSPPAIDVSIEEDSAAELVFEVAFKLAKA